MPPFYVFQRFNLVRVEPMSATSSLSGVAGFRRSLAVLVAINRYENGITSLRTPEANAEKLAFVLIRDHGFETEIIVDDQATLPRLEAFLTAMPNRIGINGHRSRWGLGTRVLSAPPGCHSGVNRAVPPDGRAQQGAFGALGCGLRLGFCARRQDSGLGRARRRDQVVEYSCLARNERVLSTSVRQ